MIKGLTFYSKSFFPFIAMSLGFSDTYRLFWIDYMSNAFNAPKKALFQKAFK